MKLRVETTTKHRDFVQPWLVQGKWHHRESLWGQLETSHVRRYVALGFVLVLQKRSCLLDEDLDSVISHRLGHFKVDGSWKREFSLFPVCLSVFDTYLLILFDKIVFCFKMWLLFLSFQWLRFSFFIHYYLSV